MGQRHAPRPPPPLVSRANVPAASTSRAASAANARRRRRLPARGRGGWARAGWTRVAALPSSPVMTAVGAPAVAGGSRVVAAASAASIAVADAKRPPGSLRVHGRRCAPPPPGLPDSPLARAARSRRCAGVRWRARPRRRTAAAREHLEQHDADEYRSDAAKAVSPRACSGEMYSAVPITEPCCVSIVSSAERATPKSATLSVPSSRTMRFCGLTSRCTMPTACAAASLRASDRVAGGDVRRIGALGRITCFSVRPGTYSIAMNGCRRRRRGRRRRPRSDD